MHQVLPADRWPLFEIRASRLDDRWMILHLSLDLLILDHQVVEQGGALLFHWDAVEALFPEGMLDNMFDAYAALLRRLSDDEAAWRTQPPCLTPAAQLKRRAAINETSAPVSDVLLHERLPRQIHIQLLRPHRLNRKVSDAHRRAEADQGGDHRLFDDDLHILHVAFDHIPGRTDPRLGVEPHQLNAFLSAVRNFPLRKSEHQLFGRGHTVHRTRLIEFLFRNSFAEVEVLEVFRSDPNITISAEIRRSSSD
jgi:hypothetical protein